MWMSSSSLGPPLYHWLPLLEPQCGLSLPPRQRFLNSFCSAPTLETMQSSSESHEITSGCIVCCAILKKTLLRMDFNRVWQHWHDFDKPRLALGISLGFESSSGCMVLLRIVTVCLSVSCSEKGGKKLIFFAAWKCRAPLSQTGWLNSNHSPRSH